MQKNGDTPMAKVQKGFLLNEHLHLLTHELEQVSGASFTRIVTAALLEYLFLGFMEPDRGQGLAHEWMRVAVLLEQGDIQVGDIPLSLLSGFIEAQENLLSSYASQEKLSDSDRETADRVRKEIKHAKEVRRGWENRIDSEGGKLEAIIDEIRSAYVRR